MISCKIVFQLIGNNFQRKLKLIATPYILQWYYNIRLVFETVFFSELVADDILDFCQRFLTILYHFQNTVAR